MDNPDRITYFEAYEAVVKKGKPSEHREGQHCFNLLYFGGWDPQFANEIRGTKLDPFYDDARIPAFKDALKEHWKGKLLE